MLNIETVVLIDFNSIESLDSKIYNIDSHKQWYSRCAKNLHTIMELTNVQNMVYASYGSSYETTYNCTDYIFKNKDLFPGTLNKKPAYSIHEYPEYFYDKNVLLAGYSLYTCMAQRELGIANLIKHPRIKNVFTSPFLTGYYGNGIGDTPDDLYKRTNQPVSVTPATKQDFYNHESFEFKEIELTDIFNLFKCKQINSR